MRYDNPFPGMNPYLEPRHIWPDLLKCHFSLVAALANEVGPRLPHKYRADLQQRVEVEAPPGAGSSPMADPVVAAPPAESVAVRVRMPREVKVISLRVETVARAGNRYHRGSPVPYQQDAGARAAAL